MSDLNAGPPLVPGTGWNRLDIATVQSAIRTLRMSRDQIAELQGYIKRLLDEEKDVERRRPLELVIIRRYQHEWELWGNEALDKTRAAIRVCVTALRLGIFLTQALRAPLSSDGSASTPQTRGSSRAISRAGKDSPDPPSAGSAVTTRSLVGGSGSNTNKPLPSTPSTARDAQTQTEDLGDQANFQGTCIRHSRGFYHEVLEIKEIPRGNPKVVLNENCRFPGIIPVLESAEDDNTTDSSMLGQARTSAPPPQSRRLPRNKEPCLPPRPTVSHQRRPTLTACKPSSFPPAAVDLPRHPVLRRALSRLPPMPTQSKHSKANQTRTRPTTNPSDNLNTTFTLNRSRATRKRSTSTPSTPVPSPLRNSMSSSTSPSPRPRPGSSPLQTPSHVHTPPNMAGTSPPTPYTSAFPPTASSDAPPHSQVPSPPQPNYILPAAGISSPTEAALDIRFDCQAQTQLRSPRSMKYMTASRRA
ncbi:hypothetical protein N657DRAFT_113172 [Parathielavia appendiculata]|uniref:Uncharacterized protein n=1 Tax=Parathielavia appendiculata TaxID=2587402 RepID=A0AAN6Z133_9PEZI|nr:hypothetical protein N657DRAFT_113172 [Parathielavia appendiculata]